METTKRKLPSPAMNSLLARSVRDIQSHHCYERKRVIRGCTEDELTEELVQVGKETALRHLHIALWFDPDYK